MEKALFQCTTLLLLCIITVPFGCKGENIFPYYILFQYVSEKNLYFFIFVQNYIQRVSDNFLEQDSNFTNLLSTNQF